VIGLGKKGKRYSPRFQFQVALEVLLKGDRDAVESTLAHALHPTTVSRWKREFLENGVAVFVRDATRLAYEKKIKEMERLLARGSPVTS